MLTRNFFPVIYTVMQLLKYTFLSLLTISFLTAAVPAPVSPRVSLHLKTEQLPVCQPWPCADSTPSSHLYCQKRRCEFCLEVGAEPKQYFVCDGFSVGRAASASNGGNISTTDIWETD